MRGVAALLGLAACGGGGPVCDPLSDGTWRVDGSAIGRSITATLTMDPGSCTFAFSEWSVAALVPDGGVIDGSAVALVGTGFDDCAGEVGDDGSVAGDCADGGTFSLLPR